MCGRYGGPREVEVFAGLFPNIVPFPKKKAVEEVFPGQTIQVIAKGKSGEIKFVDMRWGLIPASYTGQVSDWKASTKNARIETVAHTASFREAWRKKRRCIVPMDCYYEWAQLDPRAKKQRLAIRRADGKPLGVAGLWDHAQTFDGPVLSVATLTRDPGARMATIHDREPVIIEPEQFQAWLDGADDIDLTTPWSDDAFTAMAA